MLVQYPKSAFGWHLFGCLIGPSGADLYFVLRILKIFAIVDYVINLKILSFSFVLEKVELDSRSSYLFEMFFSNKTRSRSIDKNKVEQYFSNFLDENRFLRTDRHFDVKKKDRKQIWRLLSDKFCFDRKMSASFRIVFKSPIRTRSKIANDCLLFSSLLFLSISVNH